MATPITAEYFTELGYPADTAAALTTEHNRLAGMQPEQAGEVVEQPFQRMPQPIPQPSTTTAPTDAQRARAEMTDIQTRRARGEISDYQWRREFEPKLLQLAGVASSIAAYEAALPGDQNAARVAWDADVTQEAFERSIDMQRPARSVSDYQLPRAVDMSEEDTTLDLTFRQALHAAGAPIELGNHIGQAVHETARELYEAQGNLEAEVAVVERNEKRLRHRWGAAYDANLNTVQALLREAGSRSPQLRSLVEQHPELFSAPDAASYLLQLAQTQSRRGLFQPSEAQPQSRRR